MPVPEWTVVTKAEEPSEQEPLFGSGLLGGVCGFRCEKDTRPSALVKHQLQGGCYCTHEWTLGGKARTVNLHLKAFDAAMSRLILEHTSGVVNHRLSWSAECNWKVPTDVVQTHLRKEFVALLKSIGNTTVAGGSPNWRGVCTAGALLHIPPQTQRPARPLILTRASYCARSAADGRAHGRRFRAHRPPAQVSARKRDRGARPQRQLVLWLHDGRVGEARDDAARDVA